MRTLKSLAGKFEGKRLRDEMPQQRQIFFVYFCNCMCQVSMLMLLILFEVHMQQLLFAFRYTIYACFWHMFHYFLDSPFCVGDKKLKLTQGGWFCLDFPMTSRHKNHKNWGKRTKHFKQKSIGRLCCSMHNERIRKGFFQWNAKWMRRPNGGKEFALKISWRIIWGLVSG